MLERNSLNPLDLLVVERKRVSAIKEKSLTSVGFELTTSGSDHRRSKRLSYEANRELVVEIMFLKCARKKFPESPGLTSRRQETGIRDQRKIFDLGGI